MAAHGWHPVGRRLLPLETRSKAPAGKSKNCLRSLIRARPFRVPPTPYVLGLVQSGVTRSRGPRAEALTRSPGITARSGGGPISR